MTLRRLFIQGGLDNVQRFEAEGILRERERAPDRRLARRAHNAAAWALAFSMGTFIICLVIFWLIITANHLALSVSGVRV